MCAAIYQGFGDIADGAVRATLTAKLETRFAAYNQPAMVLAYYLNPARQDKTPLNTAGALTNTANLVVLAKDLYQQLCRDTTDSDAITEQMLLYSERKEPFQIGECCELDCQLGIWLACFAVCLHHGQLLYCVPKLKQLVTLLKLDCSSL